jgi:hypothetical protein
MSAANFDPLPRTTAAGKNDEKARRLGQIQVEIETGKHPAYCCVADGGFHLRQLVGLRRSSPGDYSDETRGTNPLRQATSPKIDWPKR